MDKKLKRIADNIKNDDLDKAIDELNQLSLSKLHKGELILQSAKLTELKRKIRLDTESVETIKIEKNKIRANLIELLLILEKENNKEGLRIKLTSRNSYIVNILSSLVIILLSFILYKFIQPTSITEINNSQVITGSNNKIHISKKSIDKKHIPEVIFYTKDSTIKGDNEDVEITSINDSFYKSSFLGINTFSNCNMTANNEFIFKLSLLSYKKDYREFRIKWGDNTPDMIISEIDPTKTYKHIFPEGNSKLEVQLIEKDGTISKRKYNIYSGSRPSIGAGINNGNFCKNELINFEISNWQNNSPSTLYQVSINDGSSFPSFINTNKDNVVFSHIFSRSSSHMKYIEGENQLIGTQKTEGYYLISLIAENPCGKSLIQLGPIFVSNCNHFHEDS